MMKERSSRAVRMAGRNGKRTHVPTTPFPQSADFALAALKLRNESHRMLAPCIIAFYDAKVARDAGKGTGCSANHFIVN